MLPLFILSHHMYEIATFVLYVHDVLMALGFQNNLFVIVQKKKKFTLIFYTMLKSYYGTIRVLHKIMIRNK